MEAFTLGFIYGCIGVGILWIIKETFTYIKYLRYELASYQTDEEKNEIN